MLTGVPLPDQDSFHVAKAKQGRCCHCKSPVHIWGQEVLVGTDSFDGRHIEICRAFAPSKLL